VHFVNKCGAGFGQFFFLGMTEVNQVGIMGQDLLRFESVFGAVGFKGFDTFIGKRFGDPLALIFGEQGKGIGSDFHRVQDGVFHSAAGAYVSSDIFHVILLSIKKAVNKA
jgi:hypothetical protein